MTDDVFSARFHCATGVGICWPLIFCWKGSLQNNGSIFRSGIHGNWTCNHRDLLSCHLTIEPWCTFIANCLKPMVLNGYIKMTDFWMTPPTQPNTTQHNPWQTIAAHDNQHNDVYHPSSRHTTTTTTMTTMTTGRTPFEYRFVCSVVKFSDAFFPLVKSQCVIFTQMFFSG